MDMLYEVDSQVQIAVLAPGAETDVLASVFEGIAADLGWQPGGEIRAYNDAAISLAVVACGEIVGGLQVVVGLGDDLPYRRVWPEVQIGEAPAAHVTIMALEKEYRGPGLFWPLCVELWRWCDVHAIETILMEATPATLRVYRRVGWPLEVVGDVRIHWGEECCLCRTSVKVLEEAIVARSACSPAYRALVEQGHRTEERAAALTERRDA